MNVRDAKDTCKQRKNFQVTFLMMPLEIGWAITVSWKAGDAMCRIMAFFRVFGLYLSSFVLVCISMDRSVEFLKVTRSHLFFFSFFYSFVVRIQS